MQISSSSLPDPEVADVATAVRDAQRVLGHRPAVTLLLPGGRQEQGMASLAQWAAKGAHLIEVDLMFDPGDRLHLDSPLSWTTAAVCLAAWWSGAIVTLDGPGDATVFHQARMREAQVSHPSFIIGDAIDGSPSRPHPGEHWVRAVQAFPDQPPPPRADPDRPALIESGRTWTQRQLLDAARAIPPGTAGVDAQQIDPVAAIIAVAARPLVSGYATVILRGVDRSAAEGERIVHWC